MEEEDDDVSDDYFQDLEESEEADLENLQYEPNPYHEDLWDEQ